MVELLQELKTAQELVSLLKAKRVLNDKREADLAAREKKVELEEVAMAEQTKKFKELGTAVEVLAKAEATNAANRKMLADVESKQAALETAEATQVERLNAKKNEVQMLVDQAAQVRSDKARLEEDKRTYKDKILAEIKAKLGA